MQGAGVGEKDTWGGKRWKESMHCDDLEWGKAQRQKKKLLQSLLCFTECTVHWAAFNPVL